MKKFDVKGTFLKLTEYNIPHGDEYKLVDLLPDGIEADEYGNFVYTIGESRTMFTAHLDDASWGRGDKKVKHVIDGKFIRTNGKNILGADDKAGVTLLMYMINKGVKGTYYFFLGEESGMVGAKGIINIKRQWFKDSFDRCISFDRRAYGSIISRQMGRQCCSMEFVNALKKQYESNGLPHRNDPGGTFTDSASFINIIPECSNISVGYFREHSYSESQDIEYLEKLCEASSKVKWEELPTVGVDKVSNYTYGGFFGDDYYL